MFKRAGRQHRLCACVRAYVRGVYSHTDLFIPSCHYVLHINITGEKRHDAVRNDGRHLKKKVAIVTNHSWKQKGKIMLLYLNEEKFFCFEILCSEKKEQQRNSFK